MNMKKRTKENLSMIIVVLKLIDTLIGLFINVTTITGNLSC